MSILRGDQKDLQQNKALWSSKCIYMDTKEGHGRGVGTVSNGSIETKTMRGHV